MVTAMLLLQPFPVPCSSSTIPSVHNLTSSHLLQPFGLLLSCFFLTTPAHTHASALPRPISYFLLSPYIPSLSFFQTLMALFLLQATLPSVCTIHCSCPLSQQLGQGEQDTCSARPPAFLPPSSASLQGLPLLPPCSTQGRAELRQGEFWPKNQPQPCSNFPVQTAGAELASLKAAPGKPMSILFRHTDLPSIMKLPPSLICKPQQCWQSQEQQPLRWLSAGGVHSTPSHADGMQFIPHHRQ